MRVTKCYVGQWGNAKMSRVTSYSARQINIAMGGIVLAICLITVRHLDMLLPIALLTVVITCFFMVWSYYMFTWGMKRPQHTPAYQIPLWIPQAAIGVAAVACFAYALRDAIDAILRLKRR